MRVLALVFALIAGPVTAHEFWIEPLDYQIPPDGTLQADLVNGQEFAGSKIPYLPRGFVNFIAFTNETTFARIDGRAGDFPALNQAPLEEGLHVIAYHARPSSITYEEWEKFQTFIDHKDLGDVLPVHRALGYPEEGFKEVYSRYSKSLIGVGNAEGSDVRSGLTTELVALTNPYTDDLSGGMQVQLFYNNAPRANEQIEVFEKAADLSVEITLYRTDDNGVAAFPVKPGYSYMVDSVVLREPSPELAATMGVVWETLWANLTFAVPQ